MGAATNISRIKSDWRIVFSSQMDRCRKFGRLQGVHFPENVYFTKSFFTEIFL